MSQPVERASMKVIAEEAGVSMMTVSRVFSGNGKVAPATAKLIKEVAERLQYRPNRLVRGIQTGRSGLVGVVLPAGIGSFYGKVLSGIHDYFAERDGTILLSLVHGNWGEDAINEERKALHRLIELRVDGIILRPVNDEATPLYFDEILQRGIPMVVIDRFLPNFPCDFVGTNDVRGGEDAAAILLGRNLKNLLLVTAGDKVSTSRDRAAGFHHRIKSSNKNISFDELECPDFSPNEDLIYKHLSTSGKAVDGIFAINDNLALGCFRALRKLNRRIPDEVSLVGFGAVDTEDGYSLPASTFDQHPVLIGKTAAEMLTSRVNGGGPKNFRKKTLRLNASFVDKGT